MISSPRWVVPFFALASLLLVPWVVLLVRVLPSMHRATHWDVAWGGFDVMLALLLFAVALAAWRRSPWLEGAATATATLLFVDAWFDVLTSSTRTELVVAVLEAALVELPLAVFCLLLARRAERQVQRGATATRPAERETKPTSAAVIGARRAAAPMRTSRSSSPYLRLP
jgi:hypothetical protein